MPLILQAQKWCIREMQATQFRLVGWLWNLKIAIKISVLFNLSCCSQPRNSSHNFLIDKTP